MMSLGQAAKVIKMSKSTLSRAIKDGRLSAIRKDDGSYWIDASELFRVYPNASSDTLNAHQNDAENSVVEVLRADAKGLREVLQSNAQYIRFLEAQIQDLKQERENWRLQAERSILLLQDMREKENTKKPEPKKKIWFW